MSTAKRVTLGSIVAFVLVLSLWGSRSFMLERRGFNPDELQHLHSAWCISKGMVPYRDYFDHHTPWLHYSFALVFPLYEVDTDPASAKAFLFFARRSIWILTGAILLLTYGLGRFWRGHRVALLGVLFLSNTVMFLVKTLEIRPDVPSTGLLIASVWTLSLALRGSGKSNRGSSGWLFAASGVLLGAGIMCTQKLLFALPGFFAAMLLLLWHESREGRARGALVRMLWLGAGILTPILLTLAYFGLQGAAGAFVEFNFVMNSRWKTRFSGWSVLNELTVQNPFLVALAVAGFLRNLPRSFREAGLARGEAVLTFVFFAFVAESFWIPVPTRQYALTFLPFAGLFAASGLSALLDTLFRDRTEGRLPTGARFHAAFTLVAVGLALLYARPQVWPQMWNGAFYPILGLASLVFLTCCVFRGFKDIATATLLVVLSIYPFSQSLVFYRNTMWSWLRNIEYVLTNTTPNETVMDGFSGWGVFRPHAYFYYFVHREIQVMMTGEEWSALLKDLEQGRIAPKIVLYDRYLKIFPPEIRQFLGRNYPPLEKDRFRARLPNSRELPWTDEGLRWLAPRNRSSTDPYVLIENGWSDTVMEDGRRFRRSRGRRSRLLVPIQEPRDVEVVLHARLEFLARPVRTSLSVNGTRVGEVSLAPGWQYYRFPVEAAQLKQGFNELLLTHSTTPYRAIPQYHGPNTVLAVESLALEEADARVVQKDVKLSPRL